MASRPVLPGGFFGAPDKLVDTLVRCWPARRRRDARAQDMVPKVSMLVSHWDDAGFRETKNYPNAGLNAAVANFETVFVNADLTSGKGGGNINNSVTSCFYADLMAMVYLLSCSKGKTAS